MFGEALDMAEQGAQTLGIGLFAKPGEGLTIFPFSETANLLWLH